MVKPQSCVHSVVKPQSCVHSLVNHRAVSTHWSTTELCPLYGQPQSCVHSMVKPQSCVHSLVNHRAVSTLWSNHRAVSTQRSNHIVKLCPLNGQTTELCQLFGHTIIKRAAFSDHRTNKGKSTERLTKMTWKAIEALCQTALKYKYKKDYFYIKGPRMAQNRSRLFQNNI